MSATDGDSLFFYVKVFRKHPNFDIDPEASAIYLQHQMLNKLFPAESDRRRRAVKKVSFIVDLKNFQSSNSFQMVARSKWFKWSINWEIDRIISGQLKCDRQNFNENIEWVYFINYSYSFAAKWRMFPPEWARPFKSKFIFDADCKKLSAKKGGYFGLDLIFRGLLGNKEISMSKGLFRKAGKPTNTKHWGADFELRNQIVLFNRHAGCLRPHRLFDLEAEQQHPACEQPERRRVR